VVLRGSYYCARDGSTIDAVTTSWPAGAPGGASVDPGGLVDVEGGGFHLSSRDPATHEVHLVATGDPGPACARHGVSSPCLPLRVLEQSTSRLVTVSEWTSSLKGGIEVQVVAPPVYAPVATAATRAAPVLRGIGIGLVVLVAALLAWVAYRRRASSPAARLSALAKRVRDRASRADPILAAPLAPALESALRAVRERRVDPGSSEGKRVAEVLARVEARLEERAAQAKEAEEREAADELVRQMEIALEAAQEAARIGGSRTR
jgi:hypothetical protein